MAKSRPETGDHTRDAPSRPTDGEADGEDSIEILEVVGMQPGSQEGPEGEADSSMGSQDEQDESIPYSRRDLYEMLLRKQAEFDNARKRMDREKQESRQRLWMDLLQRFLPILDNFDRALSEPSAGSDEPFHRGVALTVQQMKDLLFREGLEEIQATGERFDPHLHEAVETLVVDGLEEGLVLEDLRKGYRFQGQLLRPTLVRVSAKGSDGREGEA